MDPVIVHVDLSGLIKEIEDVGYDIERYPMELIAADMVRAIDDLIQSEGNGEWDPLAVSTLKRRPRRIGGMLLQDRGLLANIQPDDGPDWAEAASPAPYAGWHIEGTKNMPARDWTAIDLDAMLDQFLNQIMEEAISP